MKFIHTTDDTWHRASGEDVAPTVLEAVNDGSSPHVRGTLPHRGPDGFCQPAAREPAAGGPNPTGR